MSNDAATVVLNGGTLVYTGSGATIDRLFTLGTGGGTITESGQTKSTGWSLFPGVLPSLPEVSF